MRNIYALCMVFAMLFTTGCVGGGLPADTIEKKLYAAEVVWRNTLRTVGLNVDRLTPAQKESAAEALRIGQKALEAARVSTGIDFTDNISIVNSSIDILITVLESLEASNGTLISHSFA